MIAMSLKLELTQLGYEVCGLVSTGEGAVTVALQEIPDCILMDIHLGGTMDGIAAAREIQSQKSIPVIFVTGYSDAAVETRAREIDPYGFLTKPIRGTTLKPVLDSLARR
jgi:CheY-like chemotaxis protein